MLWKGYGMRRVFLGSFIGMGLTLGIPAVAEEATKPAGRGAVRAPAAARVTHVAFRAVSDQPVAGYQRIAQDSGQVIFVAPRPAWGQGEVLAIESAPTEGQLSLRLTDEALERLATTDVRQVAVFVDNRVTAISNLKIEGEAGFVALTELLPGHAQRLSRVLEIAPAEFGTPTITAVAREAEAQAGSQVIVDVFVNSVMDLRAFQVAVDAMPTAETRRGRIELKELFVETDRPNYVFVNDEAVNSADKKRGRILGAMYDGSIAALDRLYVATFVFGVSQDAQGTFQFQVRNNGDTLLRDADSLPVGFQVGVPATVRVNRPAQVE